MNITKYVPASVTRAVARQSLNLKQQSPSLLFGVGIVAGIGTVVLACRATLKIEETLDEAQRKLEMVETGLALKPEEYSEKDAQRDKALIYTQSAVSLLRLYAPAIAVGFVSVGCLTGSHMVLTNRNTALTVAYAALDKGFRQYRTRVIEEIGPEKERELLIDRKGIRHEGELTDNKIGNGSMEQKQYAGGWSMYARLFDRDTSRSWDPKPEYNYLFLRAQQNWANDRLHSRGHLFLNDVYDSLGLDRTPEGQLVGWVRGNGDDYVDFGIFADRYSYDVHRFATDGDGIMLDFNVDGVVWDLI